jgi:tyrosyl-tRNA synthetase
MKKAFCEPKNIDFCPPIAIVSAFVFGLGGSNNSAFTVSRSPENGGDVTFTSRSDLEASFADESLHPGDLKTATTTLIMDILERLSSGIKSDGDATKASKTLKATQKKLAKKK